MFKRDDIFSSAINCDLYFRYLIWKTFKQKSIDRPKRMASINGKMSVSITSLLLSSLADRLEICQMDKNETLLLVALHLESGSTCLTFTGLNFYETIFSKLYKTNALYHRDSYFKDPIFFQDNLGNFNILQHLRKIRSASSATPKQHGTTN